MKKICHLTSAHKRYDVRIFEKECKTLAKYGYDVTLVVNDESDDEVIYDVKIVSTGFNPKNRIDRILNSKNKVLEKAIQIDADIYHFHDPELIAVGNKLKAAGKKVIFDSHEDVPMQIMDKEWIPGFARVLISNFYKIYEKISVKKYDAVISVTPHIVDRFKEINKNSVMVTNYPVIDSNFIYEDSKDNVVCFAGGISDQWMHVNIIKAIENIDDIKYLLAGVGNKQYIESLEKLNGWKKVEYLGKIPHSKVKDIYKHSIAGLALNCSSQSKGIGTLGNTKIFEYMEAGLPIICSDYILWKEIIDKYDCGISVNPNNIDEIVKALNFLLQNKSKAGQMGKNGRNAVVNEFNWNAQAEKLLDIYQKL